MQKTGNQTAKHKLNIELKQNLSLLWPILMARPTADVSACRRFEQSELTNIPCPTPIPGFKHTSKQSSGYSDHPQKN